MDSTPCTYRVSVKAIIKDGQDRTLLIRERDGSWELPGGGLEQGEDPKEGLIRELNEETGYNVTWVSNVPEAFWTIGREAAFPNGLKWFGFVAYGTKVSGEFKPGISSDDEGQEARYFSNDEAKNLKLHENTRPYFA